MIYRRYVEYYKFVSECKNHCVNIQSYDLACDLRLLEKQFFYIDDKLNLAPVSRWYFEPDIEFNEVEFIKSLQNIGRKHDIGWIIRDLKLKSLLGTDVLFSA